MEPLTAKIKCHRRDVRVTHFSPPLDSDWTPWMMSSEEWRLREADDDLSGPSDRLQSSASPGSGFLESGPETEHSVTRRL